jgi:CDP-diacylglycerol--serine O-phosphatidyltransferase
MYVATLHYAPDSVSPDSLTNWFARHSPFVAGYLIFFAMVFDALDGRLARWTRHTTDFGGQLDSLADVISFGAAPAFLALQVFKTFEPNVYPVVSRLVWAVGALYMSCAAIRLAKFNVSNEHGEQHHFSFLGLPSPGAGAAVAAFVLMLLDLKQTSSDPTAWARTFFGVLGSICTWLLPLVVLGSGLLMVSNIRYPHLVNLYLRGRRSLGRLIAVLVILLLLVVAHRYTLGIGSLAYALSGATMWAWLRLRRRRPPAGGGEGAGVPAPLPTPEPAGSAHALP